MKRVCDYKMYICAHVGWVLLYHGDIQTNKIAATHFKILGLRVKCLVVCRLTHLNVFTLDWLKTGLKVQAERHFLYMNCANYKQGPIV